MCRPWLRPWPPPQLGLSPELIERTIEVYTKSDLAPQPRALEIGCSGSIARGSVTVSAVDGSNLDLLREMIADLLGSVRGRARYTLELPYDGEDSHIERRLSYLHRHPRISVLETAASDDGRHLLVRAEMDRDARAAYLAQRWELHRR